MTLALDNGAYCELSFSPNVGLVATVRRFVGEFYQRILGDAEVTSRLVVATHELLENAVRYSLDGQSTIRINVERVSSNINVTVETKNRSAVDRREALLELLAEMKASPDRAAFYQTLMLRSSKRTDGSGLGLGRIHAEAEMNLECEVADDIVRLKADASFPVKEVRQ